MLIYRALERNRRRRRERDRETWNLDNKRKNHLAQFFYTKVHRSPILRCREITTTIQTIANPKLSHRFLCLLLCHHLSIFIFFLFLVFLNFSIFNNLRLWVLVGDEHFAPPLLETATQHHRMSTRTTPATILAPVLAQEAA